MPRGKRKVIARKKERETPEKTLPQTAEKEGKSILKRRQRKPLHEVHDLFLQESVNVTRPNNRRVSFAVSEVIEFHQAQDEGTLWGNSYVYDIQKSSSESEHTGSSASELPSGSSTPGIIFSEKITVEETISITIPPEVEDEDEYMEDVLQQEGRSNKIVELIDHGSQTEVSSFEYLDKSKHFEKEDHSSSSESFLLNKNSEENAISNKIFNPNDLFLKQRFNRSYAEDATDESILCENGSRKIPYKFVSSPSDESPIIKKAKVGECSQDISLQQWLEVPVNACLAKRHLSFHSIDNQSQSSVKNKSEFPTVQDTLNIQSLGAEGHSENIQHALDISLYKNESTLPNVRSVSHYVNDSVSFTDNMMSPTTSMGRVLNTNKESKFSLVNDSVIADESITETIPVGTILNNHQGSIMPNSITYCVKRTEGNASPTAVQHRILDQEKINKLHYVFNSNALKKNLSPKTFMDKMFNEQNSVIYPITANMSQSPTLAGQILQERPSSTPYQVTKAVEAHEQSMSLTAVVHENMSPTTVVGRILDTNKHLKCDLINSSLNADESITETITVGKILNDYHKLNMPYTITECVTVTEENGFPTVAQQRDEDQGKGMNYVSEPNVFNENKSAKPLMRKMLNEQRSSHCPTNANTSQSSKLGGKILCDTQPSASCQVTNSVDVSHSMSPTTAVGRILGTERALKYNIISDSVNTDKSITETIAMGKILKIPPELSTRNSTINCVHITEDCGTAKNPFPTVAQQRILDEEQDHRLHYVFDPKAINGNVSAKVLEGKKLNEQCSALCRISIPIHTNRSPSPTLAGQILFDAHSSTSCQVTNSDDINRSMSFTGEIHKNMSPTTAMGRILGTDKSLKSSVISDSVNADERVTETIAIGKILKNPQELNTSNIITNCMNTTEDNSSPTMAQQKLFGEEQDNKLHYISDPKVFDKNVSAMVLVGKKFNEQCSALCPIPIHTNRSPSPTLAGQILFDAHSSTSYQVTNSDDINRSMSFTGEIHKNMSPTTAMGRILGTDKSLKSSVISDSVNADERVTETIAIGKILKNTQELNTSNIITNCVNTTEDNNFPAMVQQRILGEEQDNECHYISDPKAIEENVSTKVLVGKDFNERYSAYPINVKTIPSPALAGKVLLEAPSYTDSNITDSVNVIEQCLSLTANNDNIISKEPTSLNNCPNINGNCMSSTKESSSPGDNEHVFSEDDSNGSSDRTNLVTKNENKFDYDVELKVLSPPVCFNSPNSSFSVVETALIKETKQTEKGDSTGVGNKTTSADNNLMDLVHERDFVQINHTTQTCRTAHGANNHDTVFNKEHIDTEERVDIGNIKTTAGLTELLSECHIDYKIPTEKKAIINSDNENNFNTSSNASSLASNYMPCNLDSLEKNKCEKSNEEIVKHSDSSLTSSSILDEEMNNCDLGGGVFSEDMRKSILEQGREEFFKERGRTSISATKDMIANNTKIISEEELQVTHRTSLCPFKPNLSTTCSNENTITPKGAVEHSFSQISVKQREIMFPDETNMLKTSSKNHYDGNVSSQVPSISQSKRSLSPATTHDNFSSVTRTTAVGFSAHKRHCKSPIFRALGNDLQKFHQTSASNERSTDLSSPLESQSIDVEKWIQEQQKSEKCFWEMKMLSSCKMNFQFLERNFQILIEIDASNSTVKDIEVVSHLKGTSVKLFMHGLLLRRLNPNSLKERFPLKDDIPRLINFVSIEEEFVVDFGIDLLDLKCTHDVKIKENSCIQFEVTSLILTWLFIVKIDFSTWDGGRLHSRYIDVCPVLDTVNPAEIKRLVRAIPGGPHFLKHYINHLDDYIQVKEKLQEEKNLVC